jgi:CDP-glucose 4,6-dehydratase
VNDGNWLEYFAGRRVLITGHTGFKGGWLATLMKILGARTFGFALEPCRKRPALFDVASVADGMESMIGDIRDRSAVAAAFDRARPDIVFHLAAQPLVLESYESPVETFMTNVMGTVHILEAARKHANVSAIVNVTSDKAYSNLDLGRALVESDPFGGSDPYSASKGACEIVTAAYRSSFFENGPWLASVRAGNVIGGGDWAEHRLIPDVVQAIAAGQPVEIRNPESVRPWQHVLDPLGGYLRLAFLLATEGKSFADGWNFAPNSDDQISVSELAKLFIESWPAEQSMLRFPPATATGNRETRLLRLDASKAKQQLGWHPRFDIRGAVAATAEWYGMYYRGEQSMADLTSRQIADYFESH